MHFLPDCVLIFDLKLVLELLQHLTEVLVHNKLVLEHGAHKSKRSNILPLVTRYMESHSTEEGTSHPLRSQAGEYLAQAAQQIGDQGDRFRVRCTLYGEAISFIAFLFLMFGRDYWAALLPLTYFPLSLSPSLSFLPLRRLT